MTTGKPQIIYLKDYKPPAYLIESTWLDVWIGTDHTQVTARLQLYRNPKSAESASELFLHGAPALKLQQISMDGRQLSATEYHLTDQGLLLSQIPERTTLEIISHINPADNTTLEGLYQSGGMLCTQCEAEGFRKISYYLDRPDVMSVFTTRINADLQQYPILLSNGNRIDYGKLEDGRHYAQWHDPFPKPAYLFALVAGHLQLVEDEFITCSGRHISLHVYVEPHNSHKCEHALKSLQRAMRWDEKMYGREYDLDLFMIVAVDDFNMGAMENKGLNIFNSDCVLADPVSTTDAAFERIEAIVAHEYFHNWSGNRVTCRDWFQLSLKEGFTVFRDAQYTANTYSETVKRIDDVNVLRTYQFAEDAGPMAHPVRPSSYMEINNFYSLTVYEKGAEVVRMVHTLLGPERFRRGSDLYFSRHDGQAVTTDDFIHAMEDVSGIDLTQFQLWYNQEGTPCLTVSDVYDAELQQYQLNIRQSTPATLDCNEKQPFHLPLAMALMDHSGQFMPLHLEGEAITRGSTAVLDIKHSQQTFVFNRIGCRPIPSLLRGFSAPVKLEYDYHADDLLLLASHETDGFNRWEAAQRLQTMVLEGVMQAMSDGKSSSLDIRLLKFFRTLLQASQLDPAMVARLVRLPSEAYLSASAVQVDVELIHRAREQLRQQLAEALELEWHACYLNHHNDGSFSQDSESIGRRALKNACLDYLGILQKPAYQNMALAQIHARHNMTDVSAGLQVLLAQDNPAIAAPLLKEFYQCWKHDAQVIDKWFSMQASVNRPGRLPLVKQLLEHPAFSLKNPNKVRSVIGSFVQNAINFHDYSGSGYRWLADMLLQLDVINPQMAARLATPLGRWKTHTKDRQSHMRQQLQRLIDQPLSNELYEVISKGLAQ
jgi:aminopeptidase N